MTRLVTLYAYSSVGHLPAIIFVSLRRIRYWRLEWSTENTVSVRHKLSDFQFESTKIASTQMCKFINNRFLAKCSVSATAHARYRVNGRGRKQKFLKETCCLETYTTEYTCPPLCMVFPTLFLKLTLLSRRASKTFRISHLGDPLGLGENDWL